MQGETAISNKLAKNQYFDLISHATRSVSDSTTEPVNLVPACSWCQEPSGPYSLVALSPYDPRGMQALDARCLVFETQVHTSHPRTCCQNYLNISAQATVEMVL
jgi:hypothetical protein